MRRVDAEEPAAVGAQLLDRDLAGSRPHRQALVSALQRQRVNVMRKVLRHALPHQQQRQHDAQRDQAIQRDAGEVRPEITQVLRRAAADTTAERQQHGNTGGRADEVLHRQADHLAQVAQRRFAAVALPVGVGDEAHRGIDGL